MKDGKIEDRNLEDERIIELFWQRSQQAIEQVSQKYGGYCYSIAHRILRSNADAEECVNDTWFRAWHTMPPNRPVFLASFLGQITRRLAFNRWKANRADKRGGGELSFVLEELDECVPTIPSAEQVAEAKELGAIINQFLYTLPKRACNVFIRRYWYAESIAEIAERYHMREGAVKSSLFRSRQKMRAYLEQEGISL